MKTKEILEKIRKNITPWNHSQGYSKDDLFNDISTLRQSVLEEVKQTAEKMDNFMEIDGNTYMIVKISKDNDQVTSLINNLIETK